MHRHASAAELTSVSDVLTQTIPTVAGQCYALSYYASRNGAPSDFAITFAGLNTAVPVTDGDSTLQFCSCELCWLD